MDLLKLIQKIPFAPPIFSDVTMDKYGEKVAIPQTTFPIPAFASRRLDAKGRSLPQAIAHRGYTATYPENTIRAFEDAVEAGAHALEADVHLTKDGVVVLSHDPDLKRCFSIDKKINDCDWSYLETLRTTRTPHEPLARLQDLLELFRRPKWQSIWLMLDIKIDDDPEQLMYRLAETFRQVDPGNNFHWKNKVMLGYWTAKFIPLCSEYFPGVSITNIGFSITYSRQFLAVPDTSFNILQASLVSPYGRKLIRELQAHHRLIYSWTISDEKNMDWCIRRGVDGIVVDNVPRFLEMCKTYKEETKYRWPLKLLLEFAYFNFWVYLFGVAFRRRYGTCIDRRVEVDEDKNK